ncbi:unnamed protein product [Trichobilharzia regenti]|nr:unnamed protein product [Trichobilharzia regenti]
MSSDTPLEPVFGYPNTEEKLSERNQFRNAVIVGCGITTVTAYYVFWSFLSPAFRRFCLPFLPATSSQLDNTYKLLKYAQSRRIDRSLGSVVDLGSGDGRVVS